MNNPHELRLQQLMSRSRDPSRRPLDRVSNLWHEDARGYGHMRNCHLHPMGQNRWRVDLHNNPIAYINTLDDGRALITVRNVESWPTQTTAARLESVLTAPVWKNDNRLHVTGNNMCRPEQPAPMRDGTAFVRTPQGRVYVLNPHEMTVHKEVVDKERTPPVLAYLKSLRSVLLPMAKLGAVQPKDLEDAMLQRPSERVPLLDLTGEPNMQVLMQLVVRGGEITHGSWRLRGLCRQSEIATDTVVTYLESGLRSLKNELYKHHRCYRPEVTTCEDRYDHYTKYTAPVPGY